MWEYSRELNRRIQKLLPSEKKAKSNALSIIRRAVFKEFATDLEDSEQVDQPWVSLDDRKQNKILNSYGFSLLCGDTAFNAITEKQGVNKFYETFLTSEGVANYLDSSPTDTHLLRGLFWIDLTLGKEKIKKHFAQWLDSVDEEINGARKSKIGRGGPLDWLKGLAAMRYLAAHGNDVATKYDAARNRILCDVQAPVTTLKQLRESAKSGEKIVAACVGIAERVLGEFS